VPELDLAAWVDQMAALIGLPLDPEHRPGVVENFARIAPIAQLVMDFPLPETTEAAPVFDSFPEP
jgi:Protein of unknown function (DUF4089)